MQWCLSLRGTEEASRNDNNAQMNDSSEGIEGIMHLVLVSIPFQMGIEAGGQHVITMSGHLLAEWNLGDEGGEQGIGMHCVECEDPVVPEAVMSRDLLKERTYELHETAVHQRIVEKKDRAQRHVINHAEH